ncbi:MAG: L,D-transpeptidase family protein [Acidimicrobiia bacterium]|nr:L,D-transpeptidase family protein [Acidimicrobiia bacterium]MDX2466868.1 L,D-transpeptidase family protein [Acidimicrobiia bacterium]
MKPYDTDPSHPSRGLRLLAACAAATLLSGCLQTTGFLGSKPTPAPKVEPEPEVAQQPAQPDPLAIPEPQEKAKPGKLYEWNGNGRPVSRVVVSIDEQRARFYDGDEQIGWSTVASGVSKHATPVGHFEVLEKVEKKKSNLYGKIYNKQGKVVKSNAKMGEDKIPPGGRFDGAKMPYFMRLTYDGIGLHAGPIPRPGRPASHGCIRMPKQMAPILYEHVTNGTPVTVHGKGPDYGNYAERQRIARAKEQLAKELRAEQEAEAAAKAAETVTGTARATMPATDRQSNNQPSAIGDSAANTGSPTTPMRAMTAPTPEPAETQPRPAPAGFTDPVTTPETLPAQSPETTTGSSEPDSVLL